MKCFVQCFAIISLAAMAFPAYAGNYISFRGGEFDVLDENHEFVGLEWQGDERALDLQFRPLVGVMVDSEKDVYGYGGVGLELPVAEGVAVMPSFSVGAYHDDGDMDLGGVLEFRSAIEGSVEMSDKTRVGLEISHISNAGVHDFNPGTETLAITWNIPFN